MPPRNRAQVLPFDIESQNPDEQLKRPRKSVTGVLASNSSNDGYVSFGYKKKLTAPKNKHQLGERHQSLQH